MKQKNALSNLTELKITKLKMHLVLFTLSRVCGFFLRVPVPSEIWSHVNFSVVLQLSSGHNVP